MGKTRKITRNQNRVDASNNGGAQPWSDLIPDVLFLVLMQMGVVDFVAFSGVCKPWRSVALSNRKMFMASKPPMSIWICDRSYMKKYNYSLEDFEGRKFKTLLPRSAGRTCVGLTRGYLVLFGTITLDFCLVNPITRHELYFPDAHFYEGVDTDGVRAILVFLPSISRWVFVVLCKHTCKIWFYLAGRVVWNHVSSDFPIVDLHEFKGKIYTIGIKASEYRLCELRLDPKPKLMLLEIKNSPDYEFEFVGFVSSGENLYVVERNSEEGDYGVHELNFGEMKWVMLDKKTNEEYAFFVSDLKSNAAIKPELWSDSWLPFKRYFSSDTGGNGMFFSTDLWYFPQDCSNVNFIQKPE